MKRALVFALGLAVSLAACGGSTTTEPAPGPVVFAPEQESDGAVVFLRGRTEGTRLVADVVAKGIADVHGAAFRVRWDPEALALVETRAADAWSKSAVLLAKEAAPGQLVVAWSEKGEAAGHDATSPLVLGTLVFETKGRKGTTIAFTRGRSTVVSREGKAIAAGWRAGSIADR